MPHPKSAQNASEARTGGLGRVLITVYLILSLAATFRAVYQIITKFSEAPLAYSLSLLSGLVYILATLALFRRSGLWRVLAWVALAFELFGVLLVGTLSLTLPELFAHDSVWSYYGRGYLFIPLVLPILGMLWLRSERPQRDGVREQGHEVESGHGTKQGHREEQGQH